MLLKKSVKALLHVLLQFYKVRGRSAHVHELVFVFYHIVLKKMKHRIVEHMSSSTADALGLSRAILCNGKW